MKINNNALGASLQTNVPSENRHRFQIVATGSAFKILSDSLYTHKVAAVVREISCNAYDAHVMVDAIDKPFHVTLPTVSHPKFIVRDFGPGLEKDKFVEVFTTYFQSSKQDSNDFIGCLGLGSKTPFIMSPSFIVHNFHDGHEQVWQAFVNDTGEPDIQLLSVHPSSEPSGLKVVVPIGHQLQPQQLRALCEEFSTVAEQIYRWFKVAPVVVKGENVTPCKIPYHLNQPNYKSYSVPVNGRKAIAWFYLNNNKAAREFSDTILVKMGNVVYPYNLEHANTGRFAGDIERIQKLVKHTRTSPFNTKAHPLVLELNIGDVTVAPSREALSLDAMTEQVVLSALVNSYDVMAREWQTAINSGKTAYEKYELYYSMPDILRSTYQITVNGTVPPKSPQWGLIVDPSGATANGGFLRQFDSRNLWIRHRVAGRVALQSVTNIRYDMYGPTASNSYILLIDAPYKGELREWVKSNFKPQDHVLVVGVNDNKRVKPFTANGFAEWLADGHARVVKISSLKNAPVARVQTKQQNIKLGGIVGILSTNWATSNNYTVGNVVETIDVNDFIKKVDAGSDKWIVTVRDKDAVFGNITGELQRIAPWSRSTAKTSWSSPGKCEVLHEVFAKGKAPIKETFRQVVVAPAVMKQLIDLKHDRIFTVQQGIDYILNHKDRPHAIPFERDNIGSNLRELLNKYFRYANVIKIQEQPPLQRWTSWVYHIIAHRLVFPAQVEWVTQTNYEISLSDLIERLKANSEGWSDEIASFIKVVSKSGNIFSGFGYHNRVDAVDALMLYHFNVLLRYKYQQANFVNLVQEVFNDSRSVTTLYTEIHGVLPDAVKQDDDE